MPELPEVETIKNDLEPLIDGSVIEKIEFMWPRTLRGMDAAELNEVVAGTSICGLSRRGKYLIISLSNGKLLLVHFKMTGSFIVGRDGDAPKHTRAVIYLSDGRRLFFNDPRKFGRFQLIDPGQSPISELGVEPLSAEFTDEALAEILTRRKKEPIKTALLHQEFIAGIGNMYADESLFLAGIHPLRPADSLSGDEVMRLRRAIVEVLKQAIRNKGASVVNYVRPGGEIGTAHSHFKVAHRKGGCTSCPGQIERITVRGRGTYFCPSCQR